MFAGLSTTAADVGECSATLIVSTLRPDYGCPNTNCNWLTKRVGLRQGFLNTISSMFAERGDARGVAGRPDIRSSRWGQDIGSRPDFKEEFQLDLNKTLIPRFTRRSFLAGLGAASALPILAACQPQVVTEERVQVVEKEVPVERVVTQVVREVVEKVVTVEVEKAVEVEKVVTVEVEKAVEVVKKEVVEVEKEVIVEKEKVVTVAPVMMEKKVVTTWGWVSLATAEDWAVDGVTMGEAFQEETGIIQEHVPVHWSRYNDALKAAVPAGVGPNAFENNWSHISPMASEEFIAPLQDYAVSEWGGGWKDLFVAGLIDELEHLGQIDGSNNIYSIPIRGQAIGQYYANLDLFKEHDLDLPTTWDEFVKVNDTFVAAGVPAVAMGSKDTWWANTYWTLMLETAAPGYRDAIDWEGTGSFDSDECRAGLELYKMLFDRNWTQPNPLSTGVGDARSAWIRMEAASMVGWDGWWGIAQSGGDAGNGDQWGIFEPPGGKTLAAISTSWAITQVAKDKDLAFELTKWYTQGRGQEMVAARPALTGKVGVKLGSVNPTFDKNVIEPTKSILASGKTIMRWARCSATDVSIAPGMQGLIDGRSTIDDVLEEAQKVWETQC